MSHCTDGGDPRVTSKARIAAYGKLLDALNNASNPCDSADGIKLRNPQLIPKNSASDSVQMLADVQAKAGKKLHGVFFKISLAPPQTPPYLNATNGTLIDDTLRVEREIYKYVRSLLPYSPHFAYPIGAVECNFGYLEQLIRNVTGEKKAKKDSILNELRITLSSLKDAPLDDSDKLIIVMNEAAIPEAQTLRGFFKREDLRWKQDVLPVLFQLTYTLYLMQLVGLQHTDMHTNNCFVYSFNRPIAIRYTVSPTESFLVKSCHFVAFFDWDRSTKSPTPTSRVQIRNPTIGALYGTKGYPSYFEEGLDFYKVMLSINPWNDKISEKFTAWRSKFIPQYAKELAGSSNTACPANVRGSDSTSPRFSTAMQFVESYVPNARDVLRQERRSRYQNLQSPKAIDENKIWFCPMTAYLIEMGEMSSLPDVLSRGFPEFKNKKGKATMSFSIETLIA